MKNETHTRSEALELAPGADRSGLLIHLVFLLIGAICLFWVASCKGAELKPRGHGLLSGSHVSDARDCAGRRG